MPRNVEIKAYVKDLAKVKEIAASLSGDSTGTVLVQRDTFFNVSSGRLKLRILKDDPEAKLIYYNRNDQGGPKLSDYHITLVKNYVDLEKTLTLALGKKGEVIQIFLSSFAFPVITICTACTANALLMHSAFDPTFCSSFSWLVSFFTFLISFYFVLFRFLTEIF